MLPESVEETMCISQEPEERGPLCNDNDGSAGGAVFSSLPTSLTYTGVECDSEFHRPRKTGVGCMSQTSRSQLPIVRMMDNNELDQYEPGWSKLRDPGLEAAVDRLVLGIEKRLPGLSES